MGGDEKDTKKYSFVSLPRSAVEKLEKGYRWVVSVQMSASFCFFCAGFASGGLQRASELLALPFFLKSPTFHSIHRDRDGIRVYITSIIDAS